MLDQRVADGVRLGDLAAERAVEELHRAQPRQENLFMLVGAGADEDAGAAPVVRALLVAGVLERAADRVEQDPVLRIGHLDPPGRDPEVQRGELQDLVVVEVSALVDVRLVGNARGLVVEQRVVPARAGDGPERDGAVADQFPVAERVPGVRESAAQADDRNFQLTSVPVRPRTV